jgi:hypothetical protein
MRKLLDKLVDWAYEKLSAYKTKRRLEELKKRDPFIYK